ncbi:MAG: TPM domain-containing protein, partial [Gemmatimonadales bacterium]|nr:TPM domain-containing protein [Gemmatimonadales bacterium]
MTSAKAILLLAALQGAAAPAHARQDEVAKLFPARPAGHVTDVTTTIPETSRRRIEQLSARLREVTGAELATVILPTIGDRPAVDVAVAIGRAWGVGANARIGDERRNAGLVILLVPRQPNDPNSGHLFIAPGQGLEGIVTDLQAARVRDLMLPSFRRGDYGAGLEVGVSALVALIARGMGVSDSLLTPPEPARRRQGEPRALVKGIVALVIVIAVIVIALGNAGGGPPTGRGRRRRAQR